MGSPASSDDGLDVVVDPDGALTVPAEELARHGVRLRPGSHLHVVFESTSGKVVVVPSPERTRREPGHGSVRGSLAHLVTSADVDAFEAALAEAKADRIASADQ